MQWDEVSGVHVAEEPAEFSERALVSLITRAAHTKQRLVYIGALKCNALHRVGVLRHREALPFSHAEQPFAACNLVLKARSGFGGGNQRNV